MKKIIHYKICGLEYVYLINAPTKKTKRGESYIDLPMNVIEKAIARKIIEDRIPVRGAEVVFLRKALGMTLNQWAQKLGITAAGLLKWERAKNKRLSWINEVAVRSLCADLLEIPLSGKWSKLVTSKDTPEKLALNRQDFKKAA